MSEVSETPVATDTAPTDVAALEQKAVVGFYDEVCRRAEENMNKTGVLEGAHYAAMQSILKERYSKK